MPRDRTGRASVLGLPNERFLYLEDAAAVDAEFQAAGRRELALRGLGPRAPLPMTNLLAVSGGGEDGAFGAGLLCGWSELGTRPAFNLVTGVSTGALTAPFAFLGPAYDGALRDVYTNVTLADIAESRGVVAAIFDDALSDTTPLYRTISRHLDETMLAALARAYDEGRLLLIGTTNLDAQIPVVWNIGAIARSGDPRALDLIRRILLASAAVPGAFPPVMIDVEVDGERFQEMHVDGGAFAQAFLYPPAVGEARQARRRRGEPVREVRAWMIRNARLDPGWASVDRRTLGIAGRAISTMIFASGFNDVLRLYNRTQQDRIDFNLAYIGADFTTELKEPFDQGYMRALFDYGYRQGRAGYRWAKAPPLARLQQTT
ncbi:MAG: patatin-like phospholipase family protein [Burkholderiales bacterium]|nr:patatin-like phospholipase family protein [Burkholderiales bacterium]